jgi:hypothetical protein
LYKTRILPNEGSPTSEDLVWILDVVGSSDIADADGPLENSVGDDGESLTRLHNVLPGRGGAAGQTGLYSLLVSEPAVEDRA